VISSPLWRLFQWLAVGLVLLISGALLGLAGVIQYLEPDLPDVAALRDVRLQVPLRIYTRDGKLLAQIGEQRRIPLAYEELPKQVIQAFLAAEDDQFFQHNGIDYPGLVRALLVNLSSGSKREGGGTITMQLARNMFLSPERSYKRKALEMISAWRIEHAFTKQEILALYLNKIFLGQRAYGVGAAAEVYFGKSVDELTLAESALIAGLPRAPSRENPITNPSLAKARRSYVLRRMNELQFITDTERSQAEQAPVESSIHGYGVDLDAPYITEMVRQELESRLGSRIYTDNFSVITTVDSRLQRSATRATRLGLLEYDSRHGYRGSVGHVDIELLKTDAQLNRALNNFPVVGGLQPALVLTVATDRASLYTRNVGSVSLELRHNTWARPELDEGALGPAPTQMSDVLKVGDVVYVAQQTNQRWRLMQIPQAQAALVVLDPNDGAIVALEGGFDFSASRFNRATQAKRQPGSSFKPFLYSAALEHGFTAASLINDAPLVLQGNTESEVWRPQNSNLEFMGPLRLREALVRSRNLVSIRLMSSLGTEQATAYLQNFGFTPDELPQNLSLALGATQISPLEIARGYAVFANGGKRVDPYLIDRVYGGDGQLVYAADPALACRPCASTVDIQTRETAHATEYVGSTGNGSDLTLSTKVAPQVISTANAFIMTDIMKEVIRRGTATRARVLNRNDIAGKTGTTNDRRDAWFSGFNANLVATTWVGFDQERSLGDNEEGGRTALPIWIYFMKEALRGQPEHSLAQPEGVVSMRISASTGQPVNEATEGSVFEYFFADHLPDADGTNQHNSSNTSANESNDGLF
jgi:penicillin-binding protein 1A